ncbi:hypothetical protein KP509_23G032200 [Ceratopteris richardii]|nr:hypothetical protein KP509_23G032200 [Ceratopteris richardii]
MLNDGIQPDLYTFVPLFKACGIIGSLTDGMKMHTDAHKKGLSCNEFAESALISMYANCGAILESEKVFSGMSERDSVSWLAMLSAYVNMGCARKALLLYRQMHEDCRRPSAQYFVRGLQACKSLEEDEEACSLLAQYVKLAASDIGQAVHADSYKQQFASDVFVASALVSMYGACGMIAHAENVFQGLHVQDLATWNSLLSAYISQGQAVSALQLFLELHERNMVASRLTFVIALQACASSAEEEEEEDGEEEEEEAEEEEEEEEDDPQEKNSSAGKEKSVKFVSRVLAQALHDDASNKGFLSDVLVGSALINLYGKCGNISEAGKIFERVINPNVISWTAMMSAYLEQGEGDKVLQLYRQMKAERIYLDGQSYVLVIQACSALKKYEEPTYQSATIIEVGQALHSEIRLLGFISNIFVSSALIMMYGKHGTLAQVENIFANLAVHNLITWTALLSVYAEHGEAIKVLQSFCQVLAEGIKPDEPMFALALQACGELRDRIDSKPQENTVIVCLEIARGLHSDCEHLGQAMDIQVARNLIDMYGKCNAITYVENVLNVFPGNKPALYGSVISAYIENDLPEKAIRLYKHIGRGNLVVDYVVFSSILRASTDIGSIDVCMDVHFCLASTGLDSNLNLTNTLIHTYGSCGSVIDSYSVANGFPQLDMVSWSSCIAAFAQGGDLACLEMLLNMQAEGSEPATMTFLSVLTCCSHAGLAYEGLLYYISMRKDYNISILPKHYLALTDLLGRVGDYRRIENFVWQSPISNDASPWLVLLAACCRQGNVQLGGLAFDRVLAVEPEEASAYVLMVNTLSVE